LLAFEGASTVLNVARELMSPLRSSPSALQRASYGASIVFKRAQRAFA
jgi:hypothetical protein